MTTRWKADVAWHDAFARRLLAASRRCRVSLVDLSRRSGVPYATLHGYIAHSRRVPAYAVVRLAAALGVQVSELLEDSSNQAK